VVIILLSLTKANSADVMRPQIMTQTWPYVGKYVEDLMRTTIQQSIRGSLPSKFQNFSFGTIDLGDVVCFFCINNFSFDYGN